MRNGSKACGRGEPAEPGSAEDGADSLELGFAQVYQSVGDCLEGDVAGTGDLRQVKSRELWKRNCHPRRSSPIAGIRLLDSPWKRAS
jgi:hypothetical protein